jgi:sialic acid synthase SpsE
MKQRQIRIADRQVGPGGSTFIVAEAGVNHKGSLERARQMIWEAAGAGADAIKFQSYKAETLVTRWAPRYWQDDEPSGTQYAIFKQSDAFGEQEFATLYQECERVGICFLSTPFDLRFVDLLDEMGMPAFKVASADITNHPMLRRIAAKGKPVLVSTGASTAEEIRAAVQVIHSEGNDQIVLLHCVLSYPTPDEQANLLRIPALGRAFPDCIVGLSDHTIPDASVTVPVAAVALGAAVVEKHFTLNRSWPGDDHYLSVDPPLLSTMVKNIRIVEAALGSPELGVLPVEEPARQYARRSIVAAQDIPAGTRLSQDMLIMKRPGTGIPPSQMDRVVGRVTKTTVREDEALAWGMLED